MDVLRAMVAAGGDITFYTRRVMRPDLLGAVPTVTAIPNALARLHHPRLEAWAVRRIQARFLRDLRPGDIAWVWPTTQSWVHEAVAEKGNPLVLEGINTRMAHARRILDAEYRREGLPPKSGITDAAIAEEERQLALADLFFAPSPGVIAALRAPDSAFRGTILPTTYGAWPPPPGARPYRAQARPVFLCCANMSLRKGTHLLLRAWARADVDADLHLVGHLDPEIGTLCARELSLPNVHRFDYTMDLAAVFAKADAFVMPSLEEGSPQVTAFAAVRGIPLIVSPMGGSWLHDRPGACIPIVPHDIDGFADAIRRVASDPSLRAALSHGVLEASTDVDWAIVGTRRLQLLEGVLGEGAGC